jgi:hypothetical protein
MQKRQITKRKEIFIIVMTKKEFQQELKSSANIAVQRANKFLERLDLTLHINWEYEDWGYNNLTDAIGVYERDSIFEGDISIGFNINNLYKWFVKDIKENPWSDPYTILDEATQTNVFHEMGHGIIELFNDYLQETDDLDELYDNNQQLFDNVLDNEEDSVEEFAWAMYDNQLGNCGLYKLIELYISWNNTQKRSLNESQGVVENGFDKFAEYLYERCRNTKQKPNKYGDINFMIHTKLWNKYNTYKLNFDKIQISIITMRKLSELASFSYYRGVPNITIDSDLLYYGKEKFVSVVMHELTHAVNGLSNLKYGEHPITRADRQTKLKRYNTPSYTKQGQIEYLFKPTEMNARITEAYYYLKGKVNDIKYLYNDDSDVNSLCIYIFNDISKITYYKTMINYVKKCFKDSDNNTMNSYENYIEDIDSIQNDVNTYTSKLRLKNNKPSKDDKFVEYFKKKMDIVYFMQNECEKFKKRIYKMIYKFLNDFVINKNNLNESYNITDFENGFEKYIIKRKNPQQSLAESLTNRIFEIFKSMLY